MQVMGMTLGPNQQSAVAEEVKTSLRNLHLMNSSKMFIRTRTKFWLDDPSIPSNIQTDELPRGIYCLDYGSATLNGVVLISYTWGDDSTKLLAVEKEKRFEIFKNTIATINPRFAEHLVPVDGQIFNVDWQLEDYYYGAFKLQYPGQDANLRSAYFQFQSVLDAKADTGLYLWRQCLVGWGLDRRRTPHWSECRLCCCQTSRRRGH
jgi:tryptophan 2-monooxygenase